jgi:macrolide transport system ATP-binding/permease protein
MQDRTEVPQGTLALVVLKTLDRIRSGMRALGAWLRRLAGLVPSERRERELADEIEAHLGMHEDDNRRAGMTPEEARRAALLKLGGVEPTKEAWRDRSTIPLVANLLRDARFAMRQLRRNPLFAATAVLTLALGVCASVSIFAFVDKALLEPLPYRDPGRLVGVYEKVEHCPLCNLSYPDYLDWKRLNHTFSSLAGYRRGGFVLTDASGAEPVRGARVSAGFFRTLGVAPVLGRDFREGEDLKDAPWTVILSHAAWQQRFGGRPDVIGKTLTLDEEPCTIIGVLPSAFHFAPAGPADFWAGLHPTGSCAARRGCHNMYGVARLRDGESLETALADVTTIARQLEAQYPDSNRGQGAALASLSDVIVGQIRPVLLVLLAGAALLLLIAALNVTSLLLVRSESRRQETAVRSALGASIGRLASQFVAEGLVLVAAGTLIGLALASWTMKVLVGLVPASMMARMPFLADLGLDGRVLGFAALVAVAGTLLFALAPVLRLASGRTREGLVEGGRGGAGRTWRRLGASLVVVELATAVVLLVGAGLLGQSLYHLLNVELGIEPQGLATLRLGAPMSGYGKPEQAKGLGREVVDRMLSLPGTTAAGISTLLPVGSNSNTWWFRVLGRPYHGEHNEVPQREISPGYLDTLGATLLRGRYFREDEDETKPAVAIINHSFAREYFPGEDPIGRHIAYLSRAAAPIEIVGVVKNVQEGALDSAPRSVLYRPFAQEPDTDFAVVVRTSRPERSVLDEMRGAIRAIDPGIVTAGEQAMSDLIDDSPSAYMRRSTVWLVGGFAAAALLLGVVGLYGVVAYSVGRRTREIGIRMALGARRAVVYRMILAEAGRLTGIGLGIGMVGAVAASSLLRGLLFGVRSWDVPTLGAVAAVLGASSLLASYLPARRAASVDPAATLRSE